MKARTQDERDQIWIEYSDRAEALKNSDTMDVCYHVREHEFMKRKLMLIAGMINDYTSQFDNLSEWERETIHRIIYERATLEELAKFRGCKVTSMNDTVKRALDKMKTAKNIGDIPYAIIRGVKAILTKSGEIKACVTLPIDAPGYGPINTDRDLANYLQSNHRIRTQFKQLKATFTEEQFLMEESSGEG